MSCSLAAPLQGPVSLNLPFSSQSAGEARRALTSWLNHHGSDESSVNDARLVVTELVGNAIRHAGPLGNATVLVRWRLDGSDLLLSVADGGGSSQPQRREVDPDAESGRGLAIVEELSLRWNVERSSGVHTVHVHLPLRLMSSA